MNQLIFQFPFRTKYYEQDFYVSSNNFPAYKLIESWPSWPGKWLNIFGESGSGKTHLAKVLEKNQLAHSCNFLLDFSLAAKEVLTWMEEHGFIPLPPYIQRKAAKTANNSEDSTLYQTAFANQHGSCAAPTAGLHFTKEILAKLAKKNIEIKPVTLHVGAGTFSPVREQELHKHDMHFENYLIQR